MKKILVIGLALPLFISCKKDTPDPDSFHVTCKINGVPRAFNAPVIARGKPSGINFVTIDGLTGRTPDSDIFSLSIGNIRTEPPIPYVPAGTYTDAPGDYDVLGTYWEGKSMVRYIAGSETAALAASVDSVITHHFSVTVLAINDSTIRGTFSGELYLQGTFDETEDSSRFSGDQRKTITDGSFYARFSIDGQ